MPIYEFVCRTCGTSFEKRLKVDERLNKQPCPACEQSNTSLLMSAPARVGVGAPDVPVCPSSGEPCGCGRAGHVH